MIENRASFTARLRPLLAPGDFLDVELAYILAKYAHRAQVRSELGPDGEPLRYFEHPRRVALILIDTVNLLDPIILAAALLHDGIEDTEDLTPEFIERHWNAEVAALVSALSKVPKEGYVERLRRHPDWRVLAIKMADRLDNLRSLYPGQVSDIFRARQLTETCDLYLPLFQALPDRAPTPYQGGLRTILAEIEALCGPDEA